MQLYEFRFHFHLSDIFKILIFVLPICIYLFSGTFEKKIAQFFTKAFAVVISTVILVIFFARPIYSYWKIKQYVAENSVLVVQGEVSNFETPTNSFGRHDSESFTISDVEFCYYGIENYGYSLFLCNGGVVTGNGQKLRITYCEDPFTSELVICRIEKIE